MRRVQTENNFTRWFHEAAPYIRAHRGRLAVVYLPGGALADDGLSDILRDIVAVARLSARVVLAYGIRPQIEECLGSGASKYVDALRVTDERAMACVERQAGAARLKIESMLSRVLADLPTGGGRGEGAATSMGIASGAFVVARPYGVHGGVDFKHTGVVRRVDTAAIRRYVDAGAIALIPPLGFSPSGEVFNLSAEHVAARSAAALGADKLIVYTDAVIVDDNGQATRQLTVHGARQWLGNHADESGDKSGGEQTANARRVVQTALQAVEAGVGRAHILDWREPGALPRELYTRDGAGAMISAQSYDAIRPAQSEDIPGILRVIEPLEAAGVLARRGRDLLEMEIARFIVAVRDEAVIGCAAVYPYENTDMAELACLAMAADRRGAGGGGQLLNAAQQRAREAGARRLFTLTTQTADWFTERGFNAADIDNLPLSKQTLYNYQRRAKVFIKQL